MLISETFTLILKEINWFASDRRGLGTTNDAIEFYEFIVTRILTDIKASKEPEADEWLQRILLNGYIHTRDC